MQQRSELNEVIDHKRLIPLFQPIVDVHHRTIHGYEALIRGPSDGHLQAPCALFDAAHRAGRITDLEFLCREITFKQFRTLGLEGRLFINITPAILLERDFQSGRTLDLLSRSGLHPGQVVLELSEQVPANSLHVMQEAADHYRGMGFQLAIDDLGAGYSCMRLWTLLRPDFIKLDRHFIADINGDPSKQAFLVSVHDMARELGSLLVAEGVERREEFATLRELGVELIQGNYFARPEANPPRRLADTLFVTHAADAAPAEPLHFAETVEAMAIPVPAIPPHMSVEAVGDLFRATPNLLTLPVTDNGYPLGVVRRNEFMNLFLSRYGRDLYGRQPIAAFMDEKPLAVENDLPLEKVSQRITDHADLTLENEFLITHKRRYIGIGRVLDLLKKITDLQIRNARYANPLTMLPGNIPIYEHLERLIQEHRPFTAAYCDLDNFKPYNDHHGYGMGDLVIRKVAEILTAHATPELDFVGHIGGDDFVVVFRTPDWRVRCTSILEEFDHAAPGFYSEEERRDGGIWGLDRQGNRLFFPLLALSIGAVTPDLELCDSPHCVASLASDAKHEAKKTPGSNLFADRRRAPPTRDGAGVAA